MLITVSSQLSAAITQQAGQGHKASSKLFDCLKNGFVDSEQVINAIQSYRQEYQENIYLQDVLRGCQLHVTPPTPRARDPALSERISRLKFEHEQKLYNSIVSDVDKEMQGGDDQQLLGSFRMQSAFGVHVIAMMATLYFLAYYVAKQTNQTEAVAHVFGCIGLSIALLLESVLFIARTSSNEQARKKLAQGTRISGQSTSSRRAPVKISTRGKGGAGIGATEVTKGGVGAEGADTGPETRFEEARVNTGDVSSLSGGVTQSDTSQVGEVDLTDKKNQ